MRIQARDIIRYKNQKKLILVQGGYAGNGLDSRIRGCALSAYAGMQGKTWSDLQFDKDITKNKIYKALEAGFENYEIPGNTDANYRRYHKVGRNVARLAGLP